MAVGDFDVDAMEAKIRKVFGDWQPKAADGPEPDLGKVAVHAQETNILVEPGVSSTVSLSWTKAPDLTPDSVAKRRDDLIEQLGLAVLNRRLEELSRTDKAPFLNANAADANLLRSVRVANLVASFIPGKWKQALEAIDQEQRRLVQFGVSEAELQREISTYRTALKNAVDGASTRNTRGLTSSLLNSVNENEVFTSPQTDLALFEDVVKDLTPSTVSQAMRPIFTGGGPLATIVSPVAIDGGEAAVTETLRTSREVAVTKPAAPVQRAWPYTDFGKAGMVQSRHEISDLGTTIVTFANGVTLTVKPTTFAKDSIGINILTGSGEQNFAPDRFDPRSSMVGGLRDGGLGRMTVDEMSRALTGHVYGAGLATLGDKFLLSGGTRPADLQLEMQVLAAYLTDPAYRSQSFDQAKAGYPAAFAMRRATPDGAFSLEAKALLAGGDKREAFVPPATLATWSMDTERPALKALLANGPIHITMVGDVTVDKAIAVTASTFGALPPRPLAPQPAPGADQRHFPAPTPVPLRFTHNGLAEQGLGYVAWPTTDVVHDRTEARRIEVLAAVLKLRALDEIRERLAIAYAPGVTSSYSETYKGYGMIALQAQTSPDKLPVFFKAVDAIASKLRSEPISADELKRAREPMVEQARRGLNTNSWWINQLTFIVDRPDYIPQTLTFIRDVEAITPADIQALARKYLRDETAWKAEVGPSQMAAGVASGTGQAEGK
nr:insulinase family protein [Sphingomonas mali]